MSEQVDLPPDASRAGGSDHRSPVQTLSLGLVYAYSQPPVQVWRALTEDIALWWSERIHPEARTVLPAQPGEKWVQLWSNGGAFLGTVTHVHAPLLLRVTGPLAMTTPVTNTVEFRLELMESGSTRMHLTHHAVGMLGGADESGYTEVWDQLFKVNLANFLERR